MINLHERYGHYLNSNRKHEITGERVLGYGWEDNGKEICGYYVLTEKHRMLFDLSGALQYKEGWSSGLRL